MPSYTLAEQQYDNRILEGAFIHAKALLPSMDWTDLDLIFQIVLEHPDRFPGIHLQGEQTPERYLERWVKGYYDAANNPPSRRSANPKSACTDPAIRLIVRAAQSLTEEDAIASEKAHNLFMSAENIQGNLLEEYIASRIRAYGFLWCNGNVLRAIDFCNSDGSFLLQVKNKSNTENSSSSDIRRGTTIEKWYRLGTRTRNGIKYPDYRWPLLNNLINEHKTEGFDLPPCQMSEEDYQAFLQQKAALNRMLITDQ